MIFFLFLPIDCAYTLEPPCRGGSNEYPQSMFWSKIRKIGIPLYTLILLYKKVQVGKDQEKAQSEKDSHSKNRGGKKPNQQSGTYTMKTFRKPNEQLFSQ